MKAYAFSMLSAAAILALAAAAPTSVHAAGFGAATGLGKTLQGPIDLTACTGSIDPEHKIWLASACGGGPSGGGGSGGSGGGDGNGGGTGGPGPGGSGGGGGTGHPGRPSY
jgi:hypothetical protein